jgi:precorrin-6y C5,15-methyltransferase (decarboxylating) CbiE subunit
MELDASAIVIIGCGPGDPDYLVPAGYRAIQQAEVLAGAPRLLETLGREGVLCIRMGADISAMLDAIAPHVGRKRIAVLVTGDPGLYSLARNIVERFGRANCRVIPGISAVQTAFARLALDWQDACILTAHGRTPDVDPKSLAGRRKIAVFAGGEPSRPWLCSLAEVVGPQHKIFICSNLTLPDECVDPVSVSALQSIPMPARSVVLFIKGECLL